MEGGALRWAVPGSCTHRLCSHSTAATRPLPLPSSPGTSAAQPEADGRGGGPAGAHAAHAGEQQGEAGTRGGVGWVEVGGRCRR